MSWIDDIGTYLVTQSIGTTSNIFYQGFCEDVPNCITLLNAPGLSETYALGRKCKLIRPELDVRVRNVVDAISESKANAIHTLLDGITSQHIGSTDFFRIRAQRDPFLLEQDDNNRFIYAVNFQLEIEV